MKTISINQSIVALLMSVFILMIFGCESNITTHSIDERETLQETVESLNINASERPIREPGPVDITQLSALIREMIEAAGINPDEIRFGELSDKGYSLTGEEAWEKYMKDWDPKRGFGKTNNVIADPESIILSSSVIPPTPAQTGFIISETSDPQANGSVTVNYLGVQVTTNYSSTWNAIAVANTISYNINNHQSIQLSATVDGTTVIVTEKRDGCEYNGNPVYVSHTNGTHITVNNDTFYMAGGTDEQGCHEEVPLPPEDPEDPPTTIYISYGSVINTPAFSNYGWVNMWSYSWASQSLYYLDVFGVSQRDFVVINSGQDGGYNNDYAIVGTSEYKYPLDPTSNWWQGGDHLFGLSSNEFYGVGSWDSRNF